MNKYACILQCAFRPFWTPGWTCLSRKARGRNRTSVLRKSYGFLVTFLVALTPSALSAATTNVSFGSFFFNPNVVTISPGDTVVWTLASGQVADHTVTGTGSDPMCGSGVVGSGCEHMFSTAGLFPYICATPGHAGLGMTGLVQVVSTAPAPALLTNLTRLPDGKFQFTVSTTANHTNVVQASTDLRSSNWIPIGTVVPGSKSFVFTDTNAPGFSLRFYRVVEP